MISQKIDQATVQLTEEFRVNLISDNYNLEQKVILKNKKTKEPYERWVIKGHYATMLGACKAARESIVDGELNQLTNPTISLDEYVRIYQRCSDQLIEALKSFSFS